MSVRLLQSSNTTTLVPEKCSYSAATLAPEKCCSKKKTTCESGKMKTAREGGPILVNEHCGKNNKTADAAAGTDNFAKIVKYSCSNMPTGRR